MARRSTRVAWGGTAILCTIRRALEISTQYNFVLCRCMTLILLLSLVYTVDKMYDISVETMWSVGLNESVYTGSDTTKMSLNC
jgi:hypothetical protein